MMEQIAPQNNYAAIPLKKWPIDELHTEHRRIRRLSRSHDPDMEVRHAAADRADVIENALVSKMMPLICAKANLHAHTLDLTPFDRHRMMRRARTSVRLGLRDFEPANRIPFVLYLFARIEVAVQNVVVETAEAPR